MNTAEFAFATIGAITTIIGVIWGIIMFFLPKYQEYIRKRILADKFTQGPYSKAEIENTTKYYIKPKCCDIDPSQKEPRDALVMTREDLFEKVYYFLHYDDAYRHLLILADSGMGKTSFALNYYAYNSQLPRKKRQNIAIIPLGMPNPDRQIARIPNPDETIIFLDAYDEDTRAIQDHNERMRYLMEICHKFIKVVVTCRTQFFQREQEIPIETGIFRLDPIAAGTTKGYEFLKLYLSPFDDGEVRKYINKRYPLWEYQHRAKARELISKIPKLSIRPMLLAYIPDLVKEQKEIKYSYELYETMIAAWIKRENSWINSNDLRKFSELMAIDIFKNRELRGAEQITLNELPQLLEKWEIKIEQWKLRSRSLLNRNMEGNLKFSHRSIMEYLVTKKIFEGDKDSYGIILTDQMKIFLGEILHLPLSKTIMNAKLEVIDPNDTKAKLDYSWDAWSRLTLANSKLDIKDKKWITRSSEFAISLNKVSAGALKSYSTSLRPVWEKRKVLSKKVFQEVDKRTISQGDLRRLRTIVSYVLESVSDKDLKIISQVLMTSNSEVSIEMAEEALTNIIIIGSTQKETQSQLSRLMLNFIGHYGIEELQTVRSMNQKLQDTQIRIYPANSFEHFFLSNVQFVAHVTPKTP